jgi:hypothetical protein
MCAITWMTRFGLLEKIIIQKYTNADCRMPKPLLQPMNLVAINSNIFINEYMQLRVLTFNQKHYSDFHLLFGPIRPGLTFLERLEKAWIKSSIP